MSIKHEYSTHKRIEIIVHESTAECINRYVEAASKNADYLDAFRVHLLLLNIADKCDEAFGMKQEQE